MLRTIFLAMATGLAFILASASELELAASATATSTATSADIHEKTVEDVDGILLAMSLKDESIDLNKVVDYKIEVRQRSLVFPYVLGEQVFNSPSIIVTLIMEDGSIKEVVSKYPNDGDTVDGKEGTWTGRTGGTLDVERFQEVESLINPNSYHFGSAKYETLDSVENPLYRHWDYRGDGTITLGDSWSKSIVSLITVDGNEFQWYMNANGSQKADRSPSWRTGFDRVAGKRYNYELDEKISIIHRGNEQEDRFAQMSAMYSLFSESMEDPSGIWYTRTSSPLGSNYFTFDLNPFSKSLYNFSNYGQDRYCSPHPCFMLMYDEYYVWCGGDMFFPEGLYNEPECTFEWEDLPPNEKYCIQRNFRLHVESDINNFHGTSDAEWQLKVTWPTDPLAIKMARYYKWIE